jgi:DNA-directed RNA polymerase subunit omega
MARITVEDCLKKIDNQYDLVLLAKERTSQLNSGAEMLVEKDNDKNTVVALREIGEGKVSIDELKKNAVLRLRKEPNESDEEVIEEEVSNDDFEKEYKGEVSKSGVAILPSKRMRKAPIQNTSSPDEQKEPETTLQLTEEVKSETEEKPLPPEEEKK